MSAADPARAPAREHAATDNDTDNTNNTNSTNDTNNANTDNADNNIFIKQIQL